MKEINGINESFTGKRCRSRKLFFLLSSLMETKNKQKLCWQNKVKEMQTHHGTLLYDIHVCVCVCVCVCIQSFSHVQLFVTSWTVAHQVSLVRGIFQARIQEWVAIFLFQVVFLTQRSNLHLLCLLH